MKFGPDSVDLGFLAADMPSDYAAALMAAVESGATVLALVIGQLCPDHGAHCRIVAPLEGDHDLPEMAAAFRDLADAMDSAAVDPKKHVTHLRG